MNRQEEEK